ncbi:ATP-binding protein [Novosphingobium sp. JCM 18896]|uniref:ATP-binding protein n=1 Tax=Novosphingobium sp. JCM 18896 TaxID=2989731 RepID=UPI002222FC91|nr:ATP-binding protein [Novosphingobium sp. JCM 18896]
MGWPLLAITAQQDAQRFKFDWPGYPILIALAVASYFFFGPPAFFAAYLIMLPLMWLAWRYGLQGAGWGAFVTNGTGLILQTMPGSYTHRLAAAGFSPIEVGFFVELFLAVSVLASIPLAIGRAKHIAREAALQDALTTTRLQEERWRMAIDGSGLGVWNRDQIKRHLEVSSTWRKMRGYGERDLLPKDADLAHPDDRTFVSEEYRRHIAGETAQLEFEYRARCKDGNYKWFLARGMVSERGESGEPTRITGIEMDIDLAMQNAIKSMRHSKLFSAIAAASHAILQRRSMRDIADEICRILVEEGDIALAGVCVPDETGDRIVHYTSFGSATDARYLEGLEVSTSSADVTGQGPLGRAYREGTAAWVDDFGCDKRTGPWHDRAGTFGWRGAAALPINQREGVRAILVLYTRQEGYFDSEARALLSGMAAQWGAALDAISAESTAQALQHQLHNSQRREAIGRIAGGVAHDFNNILTVIIGSSEDLTEQISDPELQDVAHLIRHSAERAAELTSSMLAFSRQQTLSPRTFDVAELLDRLEALIRRALGSELDFALEAGSDFWSLNADPAQLESAILNLALNARDAMPRGGSLRLCAENAIVGELLARRCLDAKPGEYVAIRVSDSGTGIPDEIIDKIFDPFFTTKEVGRGTGLGLSMVYGFVQQSGGFVDVETCLGKGTTISLYLPRGEPDTQTAEAPRRQEHKGGGKCILLVEDDDLVRQHVYRQLHGLGYRVLDVARAADALMILKERDDIDLLFTDLRMPGGMDGASLAERAIAARPSLSVILSSGYPSESYANGMPGHTQVKFLAKPYNKEALVETLALIFGAAPSGA